MDYNRYFTKLSQKCNEYKNKFPLYNQCNPNGDRHYLDFLTYKGFKFAYVISSERSTAYGSDFEGVIVELYISQDSFVDSYFYQLKDQKEVIEKELDLDNVVWQARQETSRKKVARVFTKKDANLNDESKWDEYIDWQVQTMARFLTVFPKYIDNLIQTEEITMTEQQLIGILKSMYETAGNGQQVAYIHLFGIKYANELKGKNLKNIAEKATGRESYATEISKGMKLRQLLGNETKLYPPQKNQQVFSKFEGVKNIILYGPPGVGKTHNTKKLISLIEEGVLQKDLFEIIQNNDSNKGVNIDGLQERTRFVTFHQSFGYEDFIEGFRPNKHGDIQIQKGILKQICEDASNDPENKYYLIIDEINRGNISKIFGELITLIEEDKRDKLEVTLPYSKEPFKVPSNLYIIGTMNSTDKSIALIDIALRRRFTFLKMEPNAGLIGNEKAKRIFIALNEYITKTLGKDYRIGHSYFMGDIDLDFVLEYKIKPLLEEYFYGDEDGLNGALDIIKQQ